MSGLSLSFSLRFAILYSLLVNHSILVGAIGHDTGLEDAPLAGHIAKGLAFERDTAASEPTAVEVFVRPPFPLVNGTTYQPLAPSATKGTLWKAGSDALAGMTAPTARKSQNASMTLASDYAIFDGTSFKTMCSSTDAACRDQCTSLARSCETASESWSSSVRAWDSSWDSKIGTSTWPLSTSTSTILQSKVWTSHYSITYVTTHMTTNPGLVGTYEVAWTSYTTANPACSTEECAKSDRSIVSTSAISSRAGNVWQTLTASDAYAVNGTAWGYSALPQSDYYRTYHITMRPPFPTPEPSCAFSQTRSCAVSPDCNKCTITGGTVELLYFPIPRTSVKSNHTTTAPKVPVTAVFQNLTMTSPSVYISFETAYAENQCGTRIGGHYPGAILELPPHELSSVFGGYGTLYSHVGDPFAPQSRTPYLKGGLFDLRDLEWPTPDLVYVNQLKYAVGGEVFNGVIFDDYSPQLVVPTSIRGLDPAWQSCALDWEGLYDPPKALQPGTAIATPTRPAAHDPHTPAAPSATPTQPAALTAKPESAVPLMIVKPSALPQSLPAPIAGNEEAPKVVSDSGVAASPASGTIRVLSSSQPADADVSTQNSLASILSADVPKPTTIFSTIFSYAPKLTEEPPLPQQDTQQAADGPKATSKPPEPQPSVEALPEGSRGPEIGASDPSIQPSVATNPNDGEEPTDSANPPYYHGSGQPPDSAADVSTASGISDPPSPTVATEQEQPNALSVLVEAGGEVPQTTALILSIGTHTLTQGGAAATVSGKTISFESDGVVFDSTTFLPSTIPLAAEHSYSNDNDASGAVTTSGDLVLTVDDQTFTAFVTHPSNVSPETRSRSANTPESLIPNTIPTTLPNHPSAPSTTAALFTLSTNIYTAFEPSDNPNAVVLQGSTISIGGDAMTLEDSLGVVSLASKGVIVFPHSPSTVVTESTSTAAVESGVSNGHEGELEGAPVIVALPEATITAVSVEGGVEVADTKLTVGGYGPEAHGGRLSAVSGGLLVVSEGGSSTLMLPSLGSESGSGSMMRSLMSLPRITQAASAMPSASSEPSESTERNGDEGGNGASGVFDAESAAMCPTKTSPLLEIAGWVLMLLWAF